MLPEPRLEGEQTPALAALLRLPASQQEVLSSHYLEGMPLEEISMMLGINTQAVKSRLARARESLRRELDRDGHLRRSTETETRS
ncbi:MAG: sigma-70 family RNA polymerase sigma factor [Phycisphaeraceae bacterium]|nr:sigma-70 family RNA polymerase sigma factor [Phycisphaeraceae bacterium]